MGDPGATYSYLDCSPSLNFRLRVGAGLELALRERHAFLPPFGGQLGRLFGDLLPDQFGDVNDELGGRSTVCPYLAGAHAYDIVEPLVALMVTRVKNGANNLPA